VGRTQLHVDVTAVREAGDECRIRLNEAAANPPRQKGWNRRRMSLLCQLRAAGRAVAVDSDGRFGAVGSAGGDSGLGGGRV